MRDEHYTPFTGSPPLEQPRLAAVRVFVLARRRGARTDTMRGSLRTGPHGWEAVSTLNGELYRTHWWATEIGRARRSGGALPAVDGVRLAAGAVAVVVHIRHFLADVTRLAGAYV